MLTKHDFRILEIKVKSGVYGNIYTVYYYVQRRIKFLFFNIWIDIGRDLFSHFQFDTKTQAESFIERIIGDACVGGKSWYSK